MTIITDANHPHDSIAERLSRLAQLYQAGQASPLIVRTIDKLFALELEISRAQFEELQADLAEFEAQYNMASQDFLKRFQAGQTDDRMDFVEWASLIQMRDNLQHRLDLLTDKGPT